MSKFAKGDYVRYAKPASAFFDIHGEVIGVSKDIHNRQKVTMRVKLSSKSRTIVGYEEHFEKAIRPAQVGAKFKTRDVIEVTDAHSPVCGYRGTIAHEVTSIPSILPERLYEVAVAKIGSRAPIHMTLKETQMMLAPQVTAGGPTPTSLTYTVLPDANDRCERVIGRDRSTTLFYSSHKRTLWDLAEEQAKKP